MGTIRAENIMKARHERTIPFIVLERPKIPPDDFGGWRQPVWLHAVQRDCLGKEEDALYKFQQTKCGMRNETK